MPKKKTKSGAKQRFNVTATGRILVAEDNPVNQKVALRFLKTIGHQATLAANGREAIDALRQAAGLGWWSLPWRPDDPSPL